MELALTQEVCIFAIANLAILEIIAKLRLVPAIRAKMAEAAQSTVDPIIAPVLTAILEMIVRLHRAH
jgi:hypothetical protein